jgi:hypothetical protein
MAIEGPLRELSIHDVFQMLDLSRKTGALRVTSALRDNDGTVLFAHGRVVSAAIRSNPAPLGLMLVRAGRITDTELDRARERQTAGDPRRLGEILLSMGVIGTRELERQMRLQVEAVVFELLSWRDGFFSFEERDVDVAAIESPVHVSTESLLMEGARRIDEWSRIVDKVPNVAVVPVLAAVHDDHATLLDLLPAEWEVLAAIDGEADLRAMAASLGRSEFDVAKVVYGLVSTGVVELRGGGGATESEALGRAAGGPDVVGELAIAREALGAGRAEDALTAARRAIGADPQNAVARLAAARALRRLRRFGDASEELRCAASIAPDLPALHLELGYAAVSKGDFHSAIESWERYLRAARPPSADADTVRAALASATHLCHMVEAYAGV